MFFVQYGGGKQRISLYALSKTNSTMMLKQKNSFEDDYSYLRKTKSAENIRCPQIVINQV